MKLLADGVQDSAHQQRAEQALGHGPHGVDEVALGGENDVLSFQKGTELFHGGIPRLSVFSIIGILDRPCQPPLFFSACRRSHQNTAAPSAASPRRSANAWRSGCHCTPSTGRRL